MCLSLALSWSVLLSSGVVLLRVSTYNVDSIRQWSVVRAAGWHLHLLVQISLGSLAGCCHFRLTIVSLMTDHREFPGTRPTALMYDQTCVL